MDDLKKEIANVERDYKIQLAANEKKAHENWVTIELILSYITRFFSEQDLKTILHPSFEFFQSTNKSIFALDSRMEPIYKQSKWERTLQNIPKHKLSIFLLHPSKAVMSGMNTNQVTAVQNVLTNFGDGGPLYVCS